MKLKDEMLFKTIKEFLTIYLPKQKCYSQNTIKSYKIALNLFLEYMETEGNTPLHNMSFLDINKTNITSFLDWLQEIRHSSASTRNQRLMALRSFSSYAASLNINHIHLQLEVAKIPIQKTSKRIVEFLSQDALKTLLSQPDSTRHIGIRNRFFMILMYDTAARCQEILDLKLEDFELTRKSPFVYLHGKGDKIRTVPIMNKTVDHLNKYLDEYHPYQNRKNSDYLFYTVIHNQRNQMSTDNVEKFIKKYGEMAKSQCNEIPDRVHPHQLRHTRSIHLYRGGMPLALLSEFLGHVEIETTRVYAYADTDMKRKAIEKATTDDAYYEEEPVWTNDKETLKKLYGLI